MPVCLALGAAGHQTVLGLCVACCAERWLHSDRSFLTHNTPSNPLPLSATSIFLSHFFPDCRLSFPEFSLPFKKHLWLPYWFAQIFESLQDSTHSCSSHRKSFHSVCGQIYPKWKQVILHHPGEIFSVLVTRVTEGTPEISLQMVSPAPPPTLDTIKPFPRCSWWIVWACIPLFQLHYVPIRQGTTDVTIIIKGS